MRNGQTTGAKRCDLKSPIGSFALILEYPRHVRIGVISEMPVGRAARSGLAAKPSRIGHPNRFRIFRIFA
jgi:hypothetical protein